jgi:hypothetical protein
MIHYYRLIFHCRHFHCHSDKSDGVILSPLIGPIVRPPVEGNRQLNFYHRRVAIDATMVFSQSYEKLSRHELFSNYPQQSCITITCTSPSSRLSYLTRVWMHFLGSIHTLLIPHTCELLYLFSLLRSALSSSLHLSRPHLTGCLEKDFKIGCLRFHNLAAP